MRNTKKITQYKQSLWLDHFSCNLLQNNTLINLIKQYNISGITSNPTILEMDIINHKLYYNKINDSYYNQDNIKIKYDMFFIPMIQQMADILMPIYQNTNKTDGYFSIEISPYLAFNINQTINQAKHIWHKISRPNIMIKIPGTTNGIQAAKTLISHGININITLLFSIQNYYKSLSAYIEGLYIRLKTNKKLNYINSVASFFISRLDSIIDPILIKQCQKQHNLKKCIGQVAIANATLALQLQNKIYNTKKWKILKKHGANMQKLLWASTSTKNKSYSKTLYIDNLIAKNTINTISLNSLKIFQQHGTIKPTLNNNTNHAKHVIKLLQQNDIQLNTIYHELLSIGIKNFQYSYANILKLLNISCT